MSDNRTIAKNTIYLYIRMLVTMFIALYTSRVILQKLGVDDYGIYQAVGGVVGFLSFVNSALATGTSRFLTYELGQGNIIRLKRTFASTFTVHVLLAALIVLIAETIGLWFVYNKMFFSPDRFHAAIITYHISIFTVVLSLIRVPLHASIIAHEKMSFYAYISIFEAFAQLAICYLLGNGEIDKLILYALLLFAIQVSLILIYGLYCSKNFSECRYRFSYDKEILKPILSFSGWSLFANGSIALSNQGILSVLNMFFAPAVVSARAISLQVINAANLLVNNFRTAVNPQIVKSYAIGDFQGSKDLLLQSTKFSFFLMLIVTLPLFFMADPILHIWLGENVPEYTAIFMKIGIIQSLFQVFDTSFYTALYAKGSLKANALISPTCVFIVFPIIFILFKLGYSPVVLSWAYLIVFAILGLLVKPILIIKIVDYTWSDIFKVVLPCLFVGLLTVALSFWIDSLIVVNSVMSFLTELFALIVIGCIVFFWLGLDKEMRRKLLIFVGLHKRI